MAATTPWHPCDDGLIPIAEALERCSKASVTDLPERIKYQSTCPSHILGGDINGRLLPEWSNPPRVEMVRRWLQTNGLVADAKELNSRWTKIWRRFQQWEQTARQDIAPLESNAMFRSETTCESYYRVIDLVDDLADWCRQLAWTIRPRLKTIARHNCNDHPAANSQLPEQEDRKGERQGDKAGDTPRKKSLRMTKEATACAKQYRKEKQSDPDTAMKAVISEYVKENGGSQSYIMRVLNCNPDQWKEPANKATKKR